MISSLAVTAFVAMLAEPASVPPRRVAWVQEGRPAVVGEVGEKFPNGAGCAAVLAEGLAPAVVELELPEDAARLAHLPLPRGVAVTGRVVTHDLSLYPPELTLAPASGTIPARCWQALAALDFQHWQVQRGGTFSVGPLPPGRWTLTASAPFHEPVTVPVQIGAGEGEIQLPDVRLEGRGRVLVDVRKDGAERLEIHVEEVRKEASGRVRYLALRHVPFEGTEPVAVELPPGEYRVAVRDANPVPLWLGPVTVLVGEQVLTVEPETVEVEGRVVVKDRGVEARLEVVVEAEHVVPVSTDELGGFFLRLPRPARYFLEIHLPDGRFHPAFLDLRDAAPGERVHRTLEVASRWLKGKVASRQGEPLAGAEVQYRLEAPEAKEQVFGEVRTGADGTFALALADKATLQLEVRQRGFLPARLAWPTPPDEVTIVLEPGLEVEGIVTDASGQLVGGASVTTSGDLFAPLSASARSAGSGRYQLTVPFGSVLLAWAPGGAVTWSPAQEKVQLVLPPQPSPSLVTLLGPNRQPLRRCRVAAVTAQGIAIPWEALSGAQRAHGSRALTGDDGRLALVVLPDGPYTLVCRTAEGQLLSTSVVLPTQQQLSLQ
ncbi:MAG TPA: carboxypeptidase-like regulatory domain-containing protein [Thermoanaerobaculaceae bacterium]|nr:carboxypeptidase-like regulatory domain-containing protein [Thermoanaerobaculaceae bacterium]